MNKHKLTTTNSPLRQSEGARYKRSIQGAGQNGDEKTAVRQASNQTGHLATSCLYHHYS